MGTSVDVGCVERIWGGCCTGGTFSVVFSVFKRQRERERVDTEWQMSAKKDAKPWGYWVIPGEDEIGQEILNKYTKRRRLETTYNFQMGEEKEEYAQKARDFALVYNIEMLRLIKKGG
jgi:hypothetical protein